MRENAILMNISLYRSLISSLGISGQDFIEDCQQLRGFRFLSNSGITHPNWDLWAEKWRSLKKTRMLPRVREEPWLAQLALSPNHRFKRDHALIHSLHGAQITLWGLTENNTNHWMVHHSQHDACGLLFEICYCRPIRCTMCWVWDHMRFLPWLGDRQKRRWFSKGNMLQGVCYRMLIS